MPPSIFHSWSRVRETLSIRWTLLVTATDPSTIQAYSMGTMSWLQNSNRTEKGLSVLRSGRALLVAATEPSSVPAYNPGTWPWPQSSKVLEKLRAALRWRGQTA